MRLPVKAAYANLGCPGLHSRATPANPGVQKGLTLRGFLEAVLMWRRGRDSNLRYGLRDRQQTSIVDVGPHWFGTKNIRSSPAKRPPHADETAAIGAADRFPVSQVGLRGSNPGLASLAPEEASIVMAKL